MHVLSRFRSSMKATLPNHLYACCNSGRSRNTFVPFSNACPVGPPLPPWDSVCPCVRRSPVDVVKSRMQSTGGAGGGMLETASLIWRTEGFAPFHRGLAPTLARAAVNHAATFLVYEAAMGWMRDRPKRGEAGEVDVDGDLMVA